MKSYKIVGSASSLGGQPGEIVEADISDAQEKRMIARGAIEVAGAKSKADTAPKSPDPADSKGAVK